MVLVDWPEKLLGVRIQKKFGKPGLPDPLGIHGVYRVWHRWGKPQNFKEKFYVPYNPQTPLQQANRAKLADAVLAWQCLTSEEKSAYNKRARGRHMSGYNLFIRNFMYG
jgi:hypothetical protein